MLKTLSAAFLATAVIAAPAFATEPAKEAPKTTQAAPVIKADQTQTKTSTTTTTAVKPSAKSDVKTDGKAEVKSDAKTDGKTDVKSDKKADATAKAMNANAAVIPSEHHKTVRHRHHHKVISANKQPVAPDLLKPAAPAKVEKRS